MGWFSKVGSFIKNNASSIVHGVLDVAGFIPGLGTVADLANAAIYAVEGDYASAAMSAMSAIPGVGDALAVASKGAKVGAKGLKIFSKFKKGKSLVKVVKGKAKVGAKALKKSKKSWKKIFKKNKVKSKKQCTGNRCFAADTLVYTKNGNIPIQNIAVGDFIYSKQENTDRIDLKKVLKTSETTAYTLYFVKLDDSLTISTTAYHKFYVLAKGWVNTISLQIGDRLYTADGTITITSIEKKRYEEAVTVYNLHIEDWESYFVSNRTVYVHNGGNHPHKKRRPKKSNQSTKGKTSKKRSGKGDPVDAVTGNVFYEEVDFELSGIIPFVWKRYYYSDSSYIGALGNRTSYHYESELSLSEDKKLITLLFPDGRIMELDNDLDDELVYIRKEKITIGKYKERYQIFYHEENLYYIYENVKESNDLYSLIEIRNKSGHSIHFIYKECNLHLIIDSVGREYNIISDNQNRITKVKLGEIQLVCYEYSMENDLTKIKDALNQTKTMKYNNHLMVKSTNKNGYSFYWEYDEFESDMKCIHTWGDDGVLEYHFEYLEGYNYNTNGLGYTETIYYNDNNLITKRIDEEGNKTEYQYNQFEELLSITDAMDYKTSFEYDKKGNMTKHIKPSGIKTGFQYDEDGNMAGIIYPNGGELKCIYNKYGNVLKKIYPDCSEFNYNYNEENLICEMEDMLGHRTRFLYDSWGNIKEVIQPDGSKSSFEHDEKGNCVTIVDSSGAKQKLEYDKLDRIISTEMPDGNRIILKYNAYDDAILVEDKQKEINFEYTWSGKIRKREELDRCLEFVYDEQEQITSIINENGERYILNYDGRGKLTKETGFDGVGHENVYDKTGRLTKIKESENKEKNFKYDEDGNIIKVLYYDGFEEEFCYNEMGNLTKVVNPHSIIEFELDIMERVKKVIQDSHTIENEYNQLGQRIKLQSSLGVSIEQGYHENGLVNQMKVFPDSITPWMIQMGFNTVGQEVSKEMGKIKNTWEYDKIGRLSVQKIINPEGKRERKYFWDINYQLKSILCGGAEAKYGYDNYGNLMSANVHGETIFRNTDAVGNIYETEKCKDRQYAKDGRLLESNFAQYKYDERGNLTYKKTKDETWMYQYYGNGFLSKVICSDGKEVTFKYDGLGRRIEKCYNGMVKRFLWDGDVLLHEWEEKDGICNSLITWVSEENEFTPSIKISGNELYNIIPDHLGTPIEMYDRDGNLVWDSSLDIYGRLKKQKTNKEDCPFRFPGQYEDIETGLYYNRFRYYSPEDGIYTQQDPIGILGGPCLYNYVSNTLLFFDLFGLDVFITYLGYKGGKPYAGFASMKGNPTAEEVLKRRYSNNFSVFTDGKEPKILYSGDNRNIARGLEQRTHEQNRKKGKTANKRNPVGSGNKKRTTYLNEADQYIKESNPFGNQKASNRS